MAELACGLRRVCRAQCAAFIQIQITKTNRANLMETSIQDIIEAVKAWPAILQGALGSALFAIVLWFIKWAFRVTRQKRKFQSIRSRRTSLQDRICLLQAVLAPSQREASEFVVLVLYRASRHGINAMIWVVYGLAAGSMIPLIGNVGFVVALYYLLKMAAAVGPVHHKSPADTQKELDESHAEMAALVSQIEQHSDGPKTPVSAKI